MAYFIRQWLRQSAIIFFLVVVNSVWDVAAANNPPGPASSFKYKKSPYAVLGVDPTTASASNIDEKIKRQYRKLCLAYHPDKHCHLPAAQRQKFEQLFKEVQAAYSDIGTAQARRACEQQQRSNQPGFAFHTSENEEALRRAFAHAFRSQHPQTRASPFVSQQFGFFDANFPGGMHSASKRPSIFGLGSASPLWNPSLRSIYVQRVTVPLQDLYTGRPNYELHLNDTVFSRVAAAFRGGIGQLLVYQSILYTLPFLRFSRVLSACWGLYIFLQHLPSIPRDECDFRANLQPGYKQNTKLIFNGERTRPGVEVQFILKEGHHPIYSRVGNNLHVSCTISPKAAATGCQVKIPALHDPDFWLAVDVPRHTSSGDLIAIPGKGWPSRKPTRARGDLIVTVEVSRWPTRKSHV